MFIEEIILDTLYIKKFQQMQVFIPANLLYIVRLSIDPIIRSASNCNYSFWYRSYHVSGQRPSASVAL